MRMARKLEPDPGVPSIHNWRTSDAEEINRRRWRAQTETFGIANADPRHPIFSNFRVVSASGLTYAVEVRDLRERQFHCTCVDFRINGLGTCKHVEAVLLHLEARFRRLYRAAAAQGSTRLDVVPDLAGDCLRLARAPRRLPRLLNTWFDAAGRFVDGEPDEAVTHLGALGAKSLPELRVSQEVTPWLETRKRAAERMALRREYELKVRDGQWPAHETKVPLFPYQREGMLHLAFAERALLADEMGLGKTIQAIAACALLHRLGRARRVLVVTPASLKTEWEEQIQRFTDLPYQLVFGARQSRLAAYAQPPFFTIVNYEQMLRDALDVNQRLRADVVILDEAQRIKNWSAKTTQAIKRLRSRYAFILTGTPIENRIDELYSLMDFLDPTVLGPLFRFNRDYYVLDDRGRPQAYANLEKLHERIKPLMLRRRKADVETELPERTDLNYFVPLSGEQKTAYDDHYTVVARLAHLAARRPLSQAESERLLRQLAMMRMICDTNYILDPQSRSCPKLAEVTRILEECRDNADVKVLVFSEWERMLELVREQCARVGVGYAWHTGSVPQRKRRAEINAFKSDPHCRVFLSTDSGAAGLNLQAATVVVNCDLPWNPAKLEQRIARAWRKHQTRAVTVINLVSENTLEHRMLDTLSSKQALADGVLDRRGNLAEIKLRSGRQSFLAKLQQLMGSAPALPATSAPPQKVLPADRALGFAQEAQQRLAGLCLRCEERYPAHGEHSILYLVVDRDAALWRDRLAGLHDEYFGAGSGDPLAPVQLEVIDRAADEAVQRLIDAGLVARTTRAVRPLVPASAADSAPPPLPDAQRLKAAGYRQQAGRKLKMARLLAGGELGEEARAAALDAILPLGCALAIENRLPEPAKAEDAFLAPFSFCWKGALSALRGFASDPTQPCQPAIEAMSQV